MKPTFHVSAFFRSVGDQLAKERPEVWTGLEGALEYLADLGPSAQAPDVKWGLAQSVFGSHCGEIRWPDPEVQSEHPQDAWRGLFVAAVDYSWIVMTVLGNKAVGSHRGNAWYDLAVPRSDHIARSAAKHLDLPNFPKG